MLHYELLDRALSNHLLPDPVLLLGARAATARRLRSEREGGVEAQEDRLRSLVWHMSHGPIAEVPERSSEQPDELPAAFFTLFLGPRHKYSCGLWRSGVTEIAGAEEAMLEAHLRARPDRGRDGHPRPRVRLGRARRCGSASATRGRASPASRTRPRQREHIEGEASQARRHERRDRHGRRQRLRPRARGRPHRLGRAVRAHAQLEGVAAAHLHAPEARGGKAFVHHFATAASPTGSRARGPPSASSRAARCPRTTCCCVFRMTLSCRIAGRSRARTTRARCARGSSASTSTRHRRWNCSSSAPGAVKRGVSSRRGGCS